MGKINRMCDLMIKHILNIHRKEGRKEHCHSMEALFTENN